MRRLNIHSVSLALVLVVGFIVQYISLNQSDYANGWDAYFYLLQTKSLLEDGHLVSQRISIIYPLLLVFKVLFNDYVLGWKVFAALVGTTSILSAYLIIKEITNNKEVALFIANFYVWSPHLFYFSAQYAKNLLGFSCFLLFLFFLIKRKFVLTLLLLVLNFLVHKLTGTLALVAFIGVVFNAYVGKIVKVKLLSWGLLLFVMLFSFPIIIDLDDFMRQSDLFTVQPQFELFYFLDDFKGLLHLNWRIEIYLVYCVCFALLVTLLYKKCTSSDYWLIPILFILLNIPFIKWDISGFSFRFFMFSILFGGLMLGLLMAEVRNKKITYSLSLICIVGSLWSLKTYNPVLHDPPNKVFEVVLNKIEDSSIIEQSELMIAHKGLAEFIKFYSGKDAMAWIPEYPIHEDSLWRITSGISRFQLSAVVLDKDMYELGFDYIMVREKDWQYFLSYVKENNNSFYDDYTDWTNPNSMRPAFMKKYKRIDEN